ncbi:hypothetical protein CFC21_011737 [Triticum aestivum]|uniref:Uncharacterized protein n=2 Tax=Triticum aestivum TaxID=4565 RepID=A0A3B5ZTY3_WHEAT|nr:putative E3 ubiquitin-protein ligase RING1a isoform X1 [Triticum aestivum]KAF6995191.1 hypothetical protein CFC21_011737 [Triticum aestivum]
MIKRRFFRQDHGDNSASSSSSSSGSDSDRDPAEEEVSEEEVEGEQEQVKEEEDDDEAEVESGEEQEKEVEEQAEDEGSGYQSEDSSGHHVDSPCAGLLSDENSSLVYEQYQAISLPVKKASSGDADSAKGAVNKDDTVGVDFNNYILKCKSVYKCKLCPRIMCLSEEMVRVHLESKRHARSKKLLGEGRLKMVLNSDGELEEEAETHAERHARTIALAQQVQKPKKDSGRQRQNRRRQKRSQNRLKDKDQRHNSGTEGARPNNRTTDKKMPNLETAAKKMPNLETAAKKRRKTEK